MFVAFGLGVLLAGAVTAAKGRWGWVVVGLLTWGVIWLGTAFLIATPDSVWGRRFYGPEKMDRARQRSHAGCRSRRLSAQLDAISVRLRQPATGTMLAAMSRDEVQASRQTPPTRRCDAEAEKVLAVNLGMTALDDARAQGTLQPSEADRLALHEVRAARRARDGHRA